VPFTSKKLALNASMPPLSAICLPKIVTQRQHATTHHPRVKMLPTLQWSLALSVTWVTLNTN